MTTEIMRGAAAYIYRICPNDTLLVERRLNEHGAKWQMVKRLPSEGQARSALLALSNGRRVRERPEGYEAKPAKPKPEKVLPAPAPYKDLRYDYAQIAEEHRELVQRAAMEIHGWQRDTLALGKTLLEVKEVLPHGQFVDWLKVEFDSGLRVLQQSMNVARLLKDNPKAHDYALLSADALYLLAAPSTPKTVRWGIQERIELTDWRPTRGEIQRIVSAARPPKAHDRALLPPPPLEPEPETIEAEYTVRPEESQAVAEVAAEHSKEERLRMAMNFAHDEQLTFEQWWEMRPKDNMTLDDCLLIFRLAKVTAPYLRELRSSTSLGLSVTNFMMPVSNLIHAIEKELKEQSSPVA